MKADKATVRKRVEEVLGLRLDGKDFVAIRQYASEQQPPWDVSDRQLWRYIRMGDYLLHLTLERDRQRLLNRHIAQRRALYGKAITAGNLRAALAVLQDEAELLHLYPPKRTELTGADGGPLTAATVELSDDERSAAIAALMGRVPGLGAAVPRPHPDGQGDAPGRPVGASGEVDDGDGADPGPLADGPPPLFQ